MPSLVTSTHGFRAYQRGPPAVGVGVSAAAAHLGRVVQLRVGDEGGVDADDDVQHAQRQGAVDSAQHPKHVHPCMN